MIDLHGSLHCPLIIHTDGLSDYGNIGGGLPVLEVSYSNSLSSVQKYVAAAITKGTSVCMSVQLSSAMHLLFIRWVSRIIR